MLGNQNDMMNGIEDSFSQPLVAEMTWESRELGSVNCDNATGNSCSQNEDKATANLRQHCSAIMDRRVTISQDEYSHKVMTCEKHRSCVPSWKQHQGHIQNCLGFIV